MQEVFYLVTDIFGCFCGFCVKHLKFKNPAWVNEMTNVGYDLIHKNPYHHHQGGEGPSERGGGSGQGAPTF